MDGIANGLAATYARVVQAMKCGYSHTLIGQADEWARAAQWGEEETSRFVAVVAHLDATHYALLLNRRCDGLIQICHGARETLTIELEKLQTLPVDRAVRTQGRLLLLSHIETCAKGVDQMAKSFGIIAGVAVLAFSTYAIWRSTQETSSTKYLTA